MTRIRSLIIAAIGTAAVTLGLALPSLAATHPPAARTTLAAPFTISLSTSGAGNTAAMQTATNHEGALLHVESVAAGSNAVVTINGILNGSLMPSVAPVFTDPSGNANDSWGGGVYLLIQSTNGQFEFAFPGKSNIGAGCPGTSDAALCWGLPYGHAPSSYGGTYAGVQNWAATNGGIKSVQVVADASWPAEGHGAYTADITSLSWNGQSLLPVNVASKVIAQDQCGPFTNRLWILRDRGAKVDVTVRVYIIRFNGQVVPAVTRVVPPAGAELVTHRGGRGIQLRYSNGIGGSVTANFRVTTIQPCP